MSIALAETKTGASQEVAKRQLCMRIADLALRGCLSKERLDEMQPVYDEILGYAGSIIAFASDVRKKSDETESHHAIMSELAVINPGDFQVDAALQRVLRKLSNTEESQPPQIFDCDDEVIGMSTWEINVGGVGMYVHRRRSLTDGQAPIYFSVENISNGLVESD